MVKNGHCEERSDDLSAVASAKAEAIFLTMRLPRRADALLAMTDNNRFNADKVLVGAVLADVAYIDVICYSEGELYVRW